MSEKRRPSRRKGKGNTGISATHITVYTMNGQPLPEDVQKEVEAFLKELIDRHSTRLLVSYLKG